MIPIKEEIVDAAFNKEKDLHDQLKKLGEKSPSDSFWAVNISREFHLPDHENYKGLKVHKIGDLWRCDFHTSNSELQEAYAIWRDYPNYYMSGDGKSMEEVLAASETEKILYNCDEYRIILLRDTILGRTDTYWGYRILRPVYALIDNKTNEVIVREDKAWRFKKILMNTLKEQESTSFINELKKRNPFKLFIVKATDSEKLEQIQSMLEISIDTPTGRYSDDLKKDNIWVCYALGYGNYRIYHRALSWWFVHSKEKPTNEEAITQLVDIVTWYDANSFVEMLKKYKEHEYDLNTVNLEDIEFKWTQITEKLKHKVKGIFKVNNINDIAEEINCFEEN